MLSTVILLIFYERFHEKKKKNRIEASFYATLFPSIAYNRLDRWGGGECYPTWFCRGRSFLIFSTFAPD